MHSRTPGMREDARRGVPHVAAALTVLVAIVLAAMFPGRAYGAVYKCANAKSAVVYQDTPCSEGHELSNFDRNPPTLSVVPFAKPPASSQRADARPTVAVRELARSERKRDARGGDVRERSHLATGMSEAEVLRRAGRPDVTSAGRGRDGRRWIYLPVAGDAQTITTVTIKGGSVTDVDRKVVY